MAGILPSRERLLVHISQNELHRISELIVLGSTGGNIDGRPDGGFALFAWQMPLEPGFAGNRFRAAQCRGDALHDFDIRRDPQGLDRAARRCVGARRGKAHGGVVAERNDCLNNTLAERSRADECRPAMVLEGTGYGSGSSPVNLT